MNFNMSNLSTSMINQLNQGFSSAKKQNIHIQTGKRLIEPEDDAGASSVNAKLNAQKKQNLAKLQNLQCLYQI